MQGCKWGIRGALFSIANSSFSGFLLNMEVKLLGQLSKHKLKVCYSLHFTPLIKRELIINMRPFPPFLQLRGPAPSEFTITRNRREGWGRHGNMASKRCCKLTCPSGERSYGPQTSLCRCAISPCKTYKMWKPLFLFVGGPLWEVLEVIQFRTHIEQMMGTDTNGVSTLKTKTSSSQPNPPSTIPQVHCISLHRGKKKLFQNVVSFLPPSSVVMLSKLGRWSAAAHQGHSPRACGTLVNTPTETSILPSLQVLLRASLMQ